MKKLCLVTLWILSLSLVTACGFHLRGQGFDLHNVSVWLLSQNPNNDFERSLKQRLNTQGAELVTDVNDAKLQLAIENYATESRVIARDSQGRPSELELIFQLDYRLAANNVEPETKLAPLEILTSRREFAYNRNLQTGQEVEQQGLIKDMQQEVISRLLLQMAKVN